MTHRPCSKEPHLLSAAADGRALTPDLEAHLRSCPSCREQVDAVTFVRNLADASHPPHQLPDPAVIWWKAQLARRWQAEREASVPIERMRWVELAAGVASLVAFLVWQWEGLVNLVSRAIPAGVAAAAAAPRDATPMALILLLCGTASVGAMILAALHRRLSGQST